MGDTRKLSSEAGIVLEAERELEQQQQIIFSYFSLS